MTTLTFPHIDYVQRTQLIEYIKSNNLKFDISEPEYTFDDLNVETQQAFADADAGKTIKSENIDDLFAKLEI